MKFTRGYGLAIGTVAAAIILLAVYTINPAMLSRTANVGPTSQAPPSQAGTTAGTSGITSTTVNNSPNSIAVGGGNLTFAINQFLPASTRIHPGESITFYAPSRSTELHDVILDLSNGTAMSSLELPFILPPGFSPQALQLAPPNNFGEPIIQNISNSRQSILALNKVLFHPAVVNQNGNVSYLLEQEFKREIEQSMRQGSILPPLSGNYTLQGTEKIVSSGLILDVAGFGLPEQGGQGAGAAAAQEQSAPGNSTTTQGESPPPPYPILSNFTVTFEKPGTYPFFCAFHPGMGGIVNVAQ